jgi:hypothetical protein
VKRGFEENASVDEGVNPNGVRTVLHFEGDTLTVQRQFDAEPHLQHARQMREAQDGQRWGDGKYIGHIPPAFYAKLLTIRGREEREKAVQQWLRDNPAFVGFGRFLRK